MSFFTKSRSSRSAASSTSLLLPPGQERHSSSAQKDYTAAFGALASQYGASGYTPAKAAPVRGATAQQASVSPSASHSSKSNARPVRAKDLGAPPEQVRSSWVRQHNVHRLSTGNAYAYIPDK